MDRINEAWEDVEREENEAAVIENIKSAGTFDDFFNYLDSLGRIVNDKGTVYSADELVNTITSVRNGDALINVITRTAGLREKVIELFASEQITQATSFEDLILKMKVIKASLAGESLKNKAGEQILMDTLIESILYVAENGPQPMVLNSITRNYNLRAKVEELATHAQA